MIFIVKEIAQKRYDICKKCDSFNTTTFTCEECGCFMKLKVKIATSFCPLQKWSVEQSE